jgi:hypothetical protein
MDVPAACSEADFTLTISENEVGGNSARLYTAAQNVSVSDFAGINLGMTIHRITVPATITHGSIDVQVGAQWSLGAIAGEMVNLTVTPEASYRLKADTLMYDGNPVAVRSFTMPDADVTITAEFEDAPVVVADDLASILAGLSPNTPDDPHTVFLAATDIDTADTDGTNDVWATINSTVQSAGKYVILDLSACTAKHGGTDDTVAGYSFQPTSQNYFNIIWNNEYMKGIVLPSGLLTIGEYAFSGCEFLTSVTIPDGVTSIGQTAFKNCSGFNSISVADTVAVNRISIPNTVTTIGNGCFAYCTGLTGVSLPANVTSIGNNVFAYCYALSNVNIQGAVSSIGESAFNSCNLSTISIPSGVTSIGIAAFSGNENLSSVYIAGSVTSFADSVFSRCNALNSITFGVGSNITSAWSDPVFSIYSYYIDGEDYIDEFIYTGTSLWNAYQSGASRAGTYTLDFATNEWTKVL